MKAKTSARIGFAVHVAGWVVGYINSYMLRGVPDMFSDGAWWGAVITAVLSAVLLVVGAVAWVFSKEYP